MHRLVIGAALLLTVFLPMKAGAEAEVESLLVRRMSDNVNIRVTLANPTRLRQQGPIVVDLFVRADEGQAWEKIKTWTDIRYLQPGYRVSRDYFGANSAALQNLAYGGRFQVKTSVRGPGMKDTVEFTSWSDTETGR